MEGELYTRPVRQHRITDGTSQPAKITPFACGTEGSTLEKGTPI